MLSFCEKRLEEDYDDQWALDIQSKVLHCIDCIAVEVRYHHNCQLHFRMVKNNMDKEIPTKVVRKTMMNRFYKARD